MTYFLILFILALGVVGYFGLGTDSRDVRFGLWRSDDYGPADKLSPGAHWPS